jgi:hypothetical protein
MKIAVGLTLAALATLVSVEAAPARIDAGKRATKVSTTERAILPENKPIERNEVLMDRRFQTGTYERKEALVGERRSAITVEEGREKKFFRTPERKEYDIIERKDSVLSGKESRFSTGEDGYRSKVAVRFQDKIGEAMPFAGDVRPVVSKRTTFDRVNRFAFRRNSDNGVTVTAAGSEQAPRDISNSSAPAPGGSGSTDTPPPADGPISPSAR